ncbi:hypothetical protein DNI29_11755 [Hymenobacter sediminis]|nr:hypothetical protein DNI29_11755 [Hymenobacter sediminis]
MHILDETDVYILGHVFEDAYLIRKRNGEYVFEDDFYGDPRCGCIDPANEWAVIAGEHISLWHAKKGLTKFSSSEHRWAQDLRLKDNLIELLIDPWGSQAAIWELNPVTAVIQKRRDFFDYLGKDYAELIDW